VSQPSTAQPPTAPYLFGDLLALARQSWVRQMAARLDQLGYPDYRRSDAAAVRFLRRRPAPVGQLAAVLGVTRQAARKAAGGLQQRSYARTERDPADSRKLNIVLTARGEAYAQAIVAVIDELNLELCLRVDPTQLAAADAILRAAISAGDDDLRAAAQRIRPPPG
jgi:DNA-binding MarR family transcriptional regulator